MRSVIALSLGLFVTASSGACKQQVNDCDENAGACRFATVTPSVAYPGKPWPLKVSFPKELDLQGVSRFPLQLSQSGGAAQSLELMRSPQGETWEPSKPFIPTLKVGAACLRPQTKKEAERFPPVAITLKGEVSVPSLPKSYTDTQDANFDDNYPWPVWAGVLPGSTSMPGSVVILNDGKGMASTSARRVKILSSPSLTPQNGVVLDAFWLMHPVGMTPWLDLIPTANIARGKLVVTTLYNSNKELTLKECDTAMTDINICRSLMGNQPGVGGKLLPLPIGFFADALGNKTLIAYAHDEGGSLQIRTNTFDDQTGTMGGPTLSHKESKVAPSPPAGMFSRAYFSLGSLSAKDSRELIVVLMDASSKVGAVSVYTVAGDGGLTAAPGNLGNALQSAIGSEAVSALTLGDLDGDTLLDLVIARRTTNNQISFKVNQGQGEFTDAPSQLPAASANPITALAVGNWDGMGTADVVATVAQDKTVFVFTNNTPLPASSDPCN